VFSEDAAVPVVIKDMSDTWGHGVFRFHDEIGRFGDGRVSIIERGPVRSVARIESCYERSTIQQDLIIYEELPIIDCRAAVDWHDRRKLLKLAFPVNVADPTATYQIPYGHIERPADGEEEPAQQWIDVTGTVEGGTGEERGYGVSLLNDCKYSFDVSDGTMRMTVLRSPPYALHDPNKEEPDSVCIDRGVQHFAYSLLPHQGAWQDAGTVRRAAELNAPLIAVPADNHAGELPGSMSFIGVEPENLALVVVKRSEDSPDLVLRLYETAGKTAECEIRLVKDGTSWSGKFGPNEIKTLRVSSSGGEVRIVETDMLEGLLETSRRESG
jgi:alpha-mannosidase